MSDDDDYPPWVLQVERAPGEWSTIQIIGHPSFTKKEAEAMLSAEAHEGSMRVRQADVYDAKAHQWRYDGLNF